MRFYRPDLRLVVGPFIFFVVNVGCGGLAITPPITRDDPLARPLPPPVMRCVVYPTAAVKRVWVRDVGSVEDRRPSALFTLDDPAPRFFSVCSAGKIGVEMRPR